MLCGTDATALDGNGRNRKQIRDQAANPANPSAELMGRREWRRNVNRNMPRLARCSTVSGRSATLQCRREVGCIPMPRSEHQLSEESKTVNAALYSRWISKTSTHPGHNPAALLGNCYLPITL